MKKIVFTCDCCGHTRDLIPDTDEHSYFRIVIQDIRNEEETELGTESDDPYESISMDICPDCLIAAGKALNQEKELKEFMDFCKERAKFTSV